MKRLDIIVKLDKVNSVTEAINKVGVGGMTVMHARGQGAADPPLVGQFYSREIIVIVVDDSKVNKLKSAIAKAACTRLKGTENYLSRMLKALLTFAQAILG